MQGLVPRQRQICIAVFAALCWGLSGYIGRAQQSASTEPKASAVPTPIPLSEIVSQAESTFRSVQNIETSLSTDQVTATVERRLPALTGEIELRGTEMAKYLTGIVPLELLYSMEIVLQKYRDQLSSWNHDLTERAKTLDTQIRQLDGLGKIWRTTLQLPELSSAAPEIPHRVQNIIELIDRTRRTAQSLRQRDIVLQGHVLETTSRLQAITPAFEQAQVNAAKNLFIQDSPPLWSLASEQWRQATQASLIPPASAALLETYLQGERAVLYLQVAIVLVFFLSLSWLRRGIKKWTADEPSLRREAAVFDLSISAAITLSFLISRNALFDSSVLASSNTLGSSAYSHYAHSAPINRSGSISDAGHPGRPVFF
jgi:hypothetical protein